MSVTSFLTRVQAEYNLPASARAMDLIQLVVGELVTNARKYPPGPVLMELRMIGASWKWSCGTAIPSCQ